MTSGNVILPFEPLLDKRLILVTGKGGVGKTTIASALALRTSELGLRTLLLGVDSTIQIEHFFKERQLQELEEREIRDNLWIMNLDRQALLDDFIKSTLKLQRLYTPVLNSPIYQYFTAVAPGFRELMTLGKIIDLENKRKKRSSLPFYDIIIVDSPATGHGLSLFEVPRSVIKMFMVGPFVKRAQKIQSFLTDHMKTTILLVTLGEEMPANEACEMYEKLTHGLSMSVSGVIINNLYPSVFRDAGEEERLAPLLKEKNVETQLGEIFPKEQYQEVVKPLLDSVKFQTSRRDLNERYVKLIREKIPIPSLAIDFLPSANDDEKFLKVVGNQFNL